MCFLSCDAMSIVKQIIKIDDYEQKNSEYSRIMSNVLMRAAKHDFVEILLYTYNYWMQNKDCLMKNNIDTSFTVNNSDDKNGMTPYIQACKNFNVDSINILGIMFAADVTIVDCDGKCGKDYLNPHQVK